MKLWRDVFEFLARLQMQHYLRDEAWIVTRDYGNIEAIIPALRTAGHCYDCPGSYALGVSMQEAKEMAEEVYEREEIYEEDEVFEQLLEEIVAAADGAPEGNPYLRQAMIDILIGKEGS